jgi:NAD(P)-dependent dehydrogenase (short-subunit alcohol dehydrogenase family)
MVTGGGSGIGEQCVRALAAFGAVVAVVDVSSAAAERVVSQVVDGGGEAFAVTLDVQDEGAVEQVVADLAARPGGLRIAVNNAGLSGPRAPLADCSTSVWRQVMGVNVDGVFFCLRAELRAMRAAGNGGAIVNVSSILGRSARAGSGVYVSSKHAVVGLTRAAAVDHASDAIRVNAVGPGHTRTPLFDSVIDDAARTALEGRYPMGRLGAPSEIAELILWLSSDAASFVTGGFYVIDGGYSAG